MLENIQNARSFIKEHLQSNEFNTISVLHMTREELEAEAAKAEAAEAAKDESNS